jgi:predicted lipid-binding transport protein (Tim44 family)
MDGRIDLVTLISLIVALVVILKLRSVLGRKTGDEQTRIERYRSERSGQAGPRSAQGDNVVTLPRAEREDAAARIPAPAQVAEAEARIRTFAGKDPAVERGLLDILRLDPDFDPEHFLRGAKQAYEMIVVAFAEGNRKLLKDLLSKEVYEGFLGAIEDREKRGEKLDQSFVGIQKADIVGAEVQGGKAGLTVKFVSQLISAVRDRAGAVISGDAQRISDVTDVWTFSRDVSTARARTNPNWRLVETQSPV